MVVFCKTSLKEVTSTKKLKKQIFDVLYSQALQCASLCGVKLHGVHPTAELESVVYITPRSQLHKISQKTPRCASHCGVELRCVLPTVESSSAVYIMPLSQNAHRAVKIEIFANLWLVLKGQWGEILLGVNISIIKEKI